MQIIIVLLALGVLALGVLAAVLLVLLQQADQKVKQAEEDALVKASAYLKAEEKRMRADAIARSKAVVRGKVAEQFVPFTEDFDYYPRDARFLGSPLDYVVFEGLTEGELLRVVFIEVKTGKSRLTARQVSLRDVIDEGLVFYEELRL